MLRLRFLFILFIALPLLALSPPGAAADCRLPVDGSAQVAGIVDGRTVLLEDGRTVVLVGIEPAAVWPAAETESARRRARQTYSPLSAFVVAGECENMVQYQLVRDGMVRVAGPLDWPGCRGTPLWRWKTRPASQGWTVVRSGL
jgi:hypothetical protein